MTLTRTAVRASAIGAGAGLLVAPFALTAPAANAAVDCGTTTPTATVINGTICEVRFDTAGSYTFTAPSGVSKLAAVIIGAGGGALGNSFEAYAGGSGLAVYVDSVDTSADIAVLVGTGGGSGTLVIPPTAGGTSSVNGDTATAGDVGSGAVGGGGSNDDFAGAAYFDSSVDANSYAAGAGSSADGFECVGGAGVTLDDIATDDTLFPGDDTTVYANGGDCSDTAPVATAQVSGNGGSVGNDFIAGRGVDGLVVLRWAATVTPEPLPSTGQPFPSGLAFVGASAVLAGGMAFAAGLIARRRRTN